MGNNITFGRVAFVDWPFLCDHADANRLPPTWQEHLGSLRCGEGFDTPVLEIDECIQPGSVIESGDSRLQLVHTPGHTTDSVSLFDLDKVAFFSGDFIYADNLYALLSTSHMGEYLLEAENVIELANSNPVIYGAHCCSNPVIPELDLQDVRDLYGIG